MIIKKRGKISKKKVTTSYRWWISKLVTCENCTCEFELESQDNVKITGDPELEASIGVDVSCPYCAQPCRLSFHPKRFRLKVRKSHYKKLDNKKIV